MKNYLRTPSRRLKTIASDAKKKGLIPVFHRSMIRVNPKNGKILKGQGRNVLVIYDTHGQIVGQRDANDPHDTNSVLDTIVAHYQQPSLSATQTQDAVKISEES